MGILSSSTSITRYLVKGKISGSVIDAVLKALKKGIIKEIDESPTEKSVGWTSFENPYLPFFDDSSFQIGTTFIFSMRIDKKNVSSKVVKKYYKQEIVKIHSDKREKPLSRNDKKQIKDMIINKLYHQTPATPNIHDVVWNYEDGTLWFFTTQKTANEDFETLFQKSFNLRIIQMFPYTTADLTAGLKDDKKDILNQLSPSNFSG